MKTLLTLALLMSLPVPKIAQKPRPPADPATHQARRGGRWYFAQSGHAVYCYGPVRTMPQIDGGLQRVATYCQGEAPMVPLRD
jgi:hypothetical protein